MNKTKLIFKEFNSVGGVKERLFLTIYLRIHHHNHWTQGFELVSGKSQNRTCIAIKREHACRKSERQKCGFKHC